jgi:hypothetical protein
MSNKYAKHFGGEPMGDGGHPFLEAGTYPRVRIGECRLGVNPLDKSKASAFVDVEILEDGEALGKKTAARAGTKRTLGFPVKGGKFPEYGITRFRNFVADVMGKPEADTDDKQEMAGEAVDPDVQAMFGRVVSIDAQPAGESEDGSKEYITPRAELLEKGDGKGKPAGKPGGKASSSKDDGPPDLEDEGGPPDLEDDFPPAGWKPHPKRDGWFWKGKEALSEKDLRARMKAGKA